MRTIKGNVNIRGAVFKVKAIKKIASGVALKEVLEGKNKEEDLKQAISFI